MKKTMKFVYEKNYKKEGNDCIIYIDMGIVETDYNYIVIRVIRYWGSWTPNEPDIETFTFKTFEEAKEWVDGKFVEA